MEQNDWAELVEQVKDHGPGAVVFYLEDDVRPDDALGVRDIVFEDGEVRVWLVRC